MLHDNVLHDIFKKYLTGYILFTEITHEFHQYDVDVQMPLACETFNYGYLGWWLVNHICIYIQLLSEAVWPFPTLLLKRKSRKDWNIQTEWKSTIIINTDERYFFIITSLTFLNHYQRKSSPYINVNNFFVRTRVTTWNTVHLEWLASNVLFSISIWPFVKQKGRSQGYDNSNSFFFPI